jgi:hypothetical protein
LPDPENRIARQHGVFVAGYDTRNLQEVSIDRIRFYQRPGEVFEDPSYGITRDVLYTPDSRLLDLAEKIKADVRPKRLLPDIAAARLPGNPIIGCQGVALFAQIRAADDFFAALRQATTPEMLSQISRIFDAYFTGARAHADVNETIDPTSNEPTTIPLAVAATALAELTGTDESSLWATAYRELAPDLVVSLTGTPRGPTLVPGTDAERLALACALFLTAWQHLQHVHGATGRRLVQQASRLLQEVQREANDS